MSDHYILDANNHPKQVGDLIEWAKWYSNEAARRVGSDTDGEFTVSTVFLGLDHRFGSQGPPVLWETMVFGIENEEPCERYTSHAEAVAGHKRFCEQYLPATVKEAM